MKTLYTILIVLYGLSVCAQNKLTQQAQHIVDEGKRLYRSEMASWYGTDIFLEIYKEKSNIGGYFSYTEDGITKCIFFSKKEKPMVIGTISFDSTYNLTNTTPDLLERNFTKNENDLYAIRKLAFAAIKADTIFKTYKNSNFNLIPLINGEEKKVYVLTGAEQTGVVIFGNDYLITFDKNNNLISTRQLHKNIIPVSYASNEDGTEIEAAMHSHLPETGDFITATDICTLMLYEKFTKWKQHNVVSKNYLNIWNCVTDELTVIPMSTIEKINKSQDKEDKKKRKGN